VCRQEGLDCPRHVEGDQFVLFRYPAAVTDAPTPRRPKHVRWALIASAIVLGLTCGGAIIYSAATRKPPGADSVKPNTSYDSVSALVAAINASGTQCSLVGGRGKQSGLDHTFACKLHGGDSLAITVYTNPADRLTELEDAETYNRNYTGEMLLVGPNWTIVGPSAVIERLATTLGGQKIVPPVPSSQAPGNEPTAKPSNDKP